MVAEPVSPGAHPAHAGAAPERGGSERGRRIHRLVALSTGRSAGPARRPCTLGDRELRHYSRRRARPLDRLAARRHDGQDVVAVHLDAGQPVGQGLLRDRAGVGLLLQRHRDGPLVVLAQRRSTGTCQTPAKFRASWKSPSDVAPSPKNTMTTARIGTVLRGVGEPHGVGQLGRHRDRDGQVMLIRSGLATLEVAREEHEELLDRPAAPDHRRRLTERRHHPVGRAQDRTRCPSCEASWPLIGANVPMRPWRCNRSIRSSRRRPSSIAR